MLRELGMNLGRAENWQSETWSGIYLVHRGVARGFGHRGLGYPLIS
jgi:hypothetical protein